MRGSKLAFRPRGVSIRTGSCSVASVLAVEPLRVSPVRPGGSGRTTLRLRRDSPLNEQASVEVVAQPWVLPDALD